MTDTDEVVDLGPEDYVWRVTMPKDGGPVLAAGEALSAFPPNAYIPEIGKKLIELGTFLMRSSVQDDEDDDFWDDDDFS